MSMPTPRPGPFATPVPAGYVPPSGPHNATHRPMLRRWLATGAFVLLFLAGGAIMAGVMGLELGLQVALQAVLVALIKRSLTWERFRNAITETVLTTASLMIIAVGASLLTRFLALSGAGGFISSAIVDMDMSIAWVLLVIIAAFGNFSEEEARALEPKVVLVDAQNRLLELAPV